jgi:hypothetical protein
MDPAAYRAESTRILPCSPEPVPWQRTEKMLAATKDVPVNVVACLNADIAKSSK